MKIIRAIGLVTTLALGLCATVASRELAARPVQAGQAPARDASALPAPPVGTGRIAGRVMDDQDRPIRRATVSISGDMRLNRSTISDETGTFSFANLPKGRFAITAIKAGYPQMAFGASRPYRAGTGLFLAEGQTAADIVLKLPRGAVVTGTVFDDHGQPMPGVPVMAYEARTSLTGERTFNNGSTVAASFTTDDHGVYRVFGLPPGEYTVGTAWFFSSRGGIRVPTDAEIQAAFQSATPMAGRGGPPQAPPPAPPTFNYTPVFYPDAVDPLGAATIVLAAGQVRDGIDVHMQFRTVVTVAGKVVGPKGPVPSVQVVLARRTQVASMRVSNFSFARADGTFTSNNLIPATYDLVAEASANADHPALWAETTFVVNGGESGPIPINLTLQPAMSMTGSVAFDPAATLPAPSLSQIVISLDASQDTPSTNVIPPVEIDGSSHFTITGVRPGRFRVAARIPSTAPVGQPAWSLLSVTADGQDVTDLPMEVLPTGAPSVVVALTDRVSALSGAITTSAGQAATDFFVVVFPADERYWDVPTRRVLSARPDGQGHYRFPTLPPGDYRVAVTTDLAPGDLMERNTLVRLRDSSAPVAIALGESKTFDVKIGG